MQNSFLCKISKFFFGYSLINLVYYFLIYKDSSGWTKNGLQAFVLQLGLTFSMGLGKQH